MAGEAVMIFEERMISDRVSVPSFLLHGKDPARVALRMLDRDHTYGEIQSASGAVSNYLRSKGLLKGDRVLLVADNSLFWVAAYLGAMQAGAVCVPLPMTIAAQDLDYIVSTTAAQFAFVQSRFAIANKDRLQTVQVITEQEVAALPNAVPFGQLERVSVESLPEIETSDLAALMFTSGSTGKPRGVMVSHGNIIANTESIVEYLGLTENDRIMTVLPFHYCYGTSLLHTHLRVGASLVVEPRFMYPEKVLERMLESRCTGFAGVPSHFQILLGKSSLRKKQFPDLRYVQQAGGHLAPTFV